VVARRTGRGVCHAGGEMGPNFQGSPQRRGSFAFAVLLLLCIISRRSPQHHPPISRHSLCSTSAYPTPPYVLASLRFRPCHSRHTPAAEWASAGFHPHPFAVTRAPVSGLPTATFGLGGRCRQFPKLHSRLINPFSKHPRVSASQCLPRRHRPCPPLPFTTYTTSGRPP
jgi:hypothetical protein